MSKLLAKIRLLTKKSVDREIEGQTFTFHPVAVSMLADMGTVFAPVVQAFRLLLSSPESTRAVTTETTKGPDGSEVKVVHAAEVSMAVQDAVEMRSRKAVDDAIRCLLGVESRELLVKLLASSLREPDDDVRAMLAEIDLGALVQFILGFLDANAKVFGPFVGQVKAIVLQRLHLLKRSGDGSPEADAAGSPSPSESPSPSAS